MSIVKSLADMGITVVATVHSPTPYCFGLFDRMLLLLRGKVAYFGPNGRLGRLAVKNGWRGKERGGRGAGRFCWAGMAGA